MINIETMKKTFYLSFIILALSTTSCGFFENCVEGDGPVVEQTITVDNFEAIELESNVIVYLKQASKQSVTIAAPQIISGIFAGWILTAVFDNQAIYILMMAGASMLLAALSVYFVKDGVTSHQKDAVTA